MPPNPLPALLDAELPIPQRRERLPENRLDHGEGRGLLQRAHEAFELLRRALDLDADPFGVVAHEPGQPVSSRQGVDERTEAHPLNDATHGDLPPLPTRRPHRASGPLAGSAFGPWGRTRAPPIRPRSRLPVLVRRMRAPRPLRMRVHRSQLVACSEEFASEAACRSIKPYAITIWGAKQGWPWVGDRGPLAAADRLVVDPDD